MAWFENDKDSPSKILDVMQEMWTRMKNVYAEGKKPSDAVSAPEKARVQQLRDHPDDDVKARAAKLALEMA